MLLIFFEIIAIGGLIFLFILVTPAMNTLNYSPHSGPISPKVVLDGTGRLHVFWGDLYQLTNGSKRVIMKYQTHQNGWVQPIALSNPFNPQSLLCGEWYYYGDLRTTLTCDQDGQVAVGWVQKTADPLYEEIGIAYYRIYNGTNWSDIIELPIDNEVGFFDLQYSLNNTLYALYQEYNATDFWWLQFWEVGSASPPITLFEMGIYGSYYLGNPKLLAGLEDHLFLFWGNQTERGLCFRAYQNESWSSDIRVDEIGEVDCWDVALGRDETIHVVWHNWVGDTYYRQFQNQTWSLSTKLPITQFGWGWLDLEVDSENNLQLLWQEYYIPPPGPFYNPLTYHIYSIKRIGTNWGSQSELFGVPLDNIEVALVMVDATQSHLVLRQWIRSASQLIHYSLEGSTATKVHTLASTVAEMISGLQIYLLFNGGVLVLGVLVFLPIVVILLRRSVHRIIY